MQLLVIEHEQRLRSSIIIAVVDHGGVRDDFAKRAFLILDLTLLWHDGQYPVRAEAMALDRFAGAPR